MKQNYFRGYPLPAPGIRQDLRGFMRRHRDAKREQADSRNAAYQERGRVPADSRYRSDPLNVDGPKA